MEYGTQICHRNEIKDFSDKKKDALKGFLFEQSKSSLIGKGLEKQQINVIYITEQCRF
ncbi:unnamed protein product [Paramecium sonneborni]|uniref:Uncharacterized protein n=1 Tax=Paramecium sonneborni TaxID=65129 RepID=A0A8S1PXR3_9CILI|nr:unnamed protein product [Paramecium sonneborni]